MGLAHPGQAKVAPAADPPTRNEGVPMTPDPAQWLQRPEPPLPDIGPDPEPPDPDDVPRHAGAVPATRGRPTGACPARARAAHAYAADGRGIANAPRGIAMSIRVKPGVLRDIAETLGRHFEARAMSFHIEEKPLGALHIGFRVDGHPASLTVAFDADAFAALERGRHRLAAPRAHARGGGIRRDDGASRPDRVRRRFPFQPAMRCRSQGGFR